MPVQDMPVGGNLLPNEVSQDPGGLCSEEHCLSAGPHSPALRSEGMAAQRIRSSSSKH